MQETGGPESRWRHRSFRCASRDSVSVGLAGVRPYTFSAASPRREGHPGETHEGINRAHDSGVSRLPRTSEPDAMQRALFDAWGSVGTRGQESWGILSRTVRGVLGRLDLWGPGPVAPEGGDTRSVHSWGPEDSTAFPPMLFLGKESDRTSRAPG